MTSIYHQLWVHLCFQLESDVHMSCCKFTNVKCPSVHAWRCAVPIIGKNRAKSML